MKKIFFITGNKNKFQEALEVIPNLDRIEFELDELQELDSKKIIEHKLKQAAKLSNENLIVEDISLEIESLSGLPGPLVKWFIKSIGSQGLFELTNKNSNVAKAVAHLGAIIDGNIRFFESSIKGNIVAPRGENGFGWDNIFQPQNSLKTFAEMTLQEKNRYSMRKMVFEQLKKAL